MKIWKLLEHTVYYTSSYEKVKNCSIISNQDSTQWTNKSKKLETESHAILQQTSTCHRHRIRNRAIARCV